MTQASYLPPLLHPVRMIGGRLFDFSCEIAVMGAVTVAPTCHDGSSKSFGSALDEAERMLHDGADMISVGLSGPNLTGCDPVVESSRLMVFTRRMSGQGAVVGVETADGSVARAALEAGASIIRDPSGLADMTLGQAIAGTPRAQLIITASARPEGSRAAYGDPKYGDPVSDISYRISQTVHQARAIGVKTGQILVDGGIHTQQSASDALALAQRYSLISDLKYPTTSVVFGPILDDDRAFRTRPVPGYDAGAIAAAVWTIAQGARIIATADVAAMKAAVAVAEGILGLRGPHHQRLSGAEARPHESRPLPDSGAP